MEITYEKFLDLICGYGLAVNVNIYKSLKRFGPDGIKFMLIDDCAVMIEDFKENIYIGVYQTSPDSDISLATEHTIERAREYFNIYDNPNIYINSSVVTKGEPLGEWDKLHGWRNFVCQGGVYPVNTCVRELTAENMPAMKALSVSCQNSDNSFEKAEGENFAYQADHFDISKSDGFHYFGYYEDSELCGVASTMYFDEVGIAWLLDLLVSPNHRRKGVGSELVICALRERKNALWVYQAARDNAPSIALAKSLGFTFEGATLTQQVTKE